MENKAIIAADLAATLQQTRAYSDLVELRYYGPGEIPNLPEEEIVVATFRDAPSVRINVTMDSGIALISDVLRGLRAI